MTLQIAEPQTKRWTRDEYYQLADAGYFQRQRVQLIQGEIIQMSPQKHPHSKAILLADRWLRESFPTPHLIRIQMPLNALDESDPEPDLAVVHGPVERLTDHPTTAIFVIEVSDTSLRLDRRKASLYAAVGVPEYWIVNIEGRCIEVHRQPAPDAAAEFGASYAVTVVAKESELISPIAVPKSQVKVADLLP